MRVGLHVYNKVVFVAGAIYITLCGVCFACYLYRARPVESAIALAQRCQDLLFGRPGDEQGQWRRQVAKELDRRKLLRARWLLPWGQAACVLYMGVSVLGTRAAWQIAASDYDVLVHVFAESSDTPAWGITVLQDVVVFAICGLSLVIWIMPRVVTLKRLNTIYSFLMLGLVMWMSPLACFADTVERYAIAVWITALALSLFNLNLRLNIVWLVLLTAMASVTLMFGARVNPVSMWWAIFDSMTLHVCTMMSVFILCGLNKILTEVVRLELEAAFSRNELSAARSVLGGVCDVVVELDEAFRLQGESSGLIDMLLLNPKRSIMHDDIRTFLHSDTDREKFTSQIQGSVLQGDDGGTVGLCVAFHARMRDGAGIALGIEAFSVQYDDPGGRRKFFVGIKEFTDTSPMLTSGAVAGRDLASATGGRSRRGCRAASGGADLRAPVGGCAEAKTNDLSSFLTQCPSCGDEEDAQTSRSSSSSEGAFSAAGGGPAPLGCGWQGAEAAVWFDLLSPLYRVKCVSAGFESSVGAPAAGDRNLLEWIPAAQRESFVDWVQRARVALMHPGGGVEAGGAVAHGDEVHFSMAHLRRQRVLIASGVALDAARPPPSEGEEGSGAPPRCKRGCVMQTADKTPSYRAPYRCDGCGGMFGHGPAAEGQNRWKCQECDYDLCFDCHAGPENIMRIVLVNPRWMPRRRRCKGAAAGTPREPTPRRPLGAAPPSGRHTAVNL